MQKTLKVIETLAHGYSSESSQRELSNEYQHNRVYTIYKNLCILVLWTKVASALEGLKIFFAGQMQRWLSDQEQVLK